jgi:hypothetical protein
MLSEFGSGAYGTPPAGRGRASLESLACGFASPDDISIQAAVEANDTFIQRLEAIRDNAQGPSIDLNVQK